MILHDIIFGEGALKQIQCILVFNRMPDIYKKQTLDDQKDATKQNKEIFDRDDIKQINTAWTECAYNEEQLKKFFGYEKIAKRIAKLQCMYIDVNDKADGTRVFKGMSEMIDEVNKQEKKERMAAERQAAKEQQKLAAANK